MKAFKATSMAKGTGLFSMRNHSDAAKNVAVLGFGTALSQFLNIISTPLLSWYYSPESFGIMATSLSVVYIVASLSNLNYETAIIMPKEINESDDLLQICFLMNILSAFLFFLLSYCASDYIFADRKYNQWWFFAMLSVGVLLLSSFNTMQYYATRTERYSLSSISHVIRTISCLFIQLVGIFFNSTTVWLIAGRVFGLFPAILYLFDRNRVLFPKQRLKDRVHALTSAARTYRRFPLYAAPQRIISLLAEELPTLVLAGIFGPGAAGYYWFSNRLLQMPCGVVSHAIGRVFSREAVKKIHNGQSPFRPALKIVVTLALLAVPPTAVIICWAPELFGFFLGEQWQAAAVFSQWIVIWVFFRFSLSPILCLFTVLGEQKRLLKLDSIAFVARTSLLAYCALKLDALSLVVVLSLFESAKIAFYGVVALRLARNAHSVVVTSSQDVSSSTSALRSR